MIARLRFYARGARVVYQGREETISHIFISRSTLFVYLNDHEDPVPEHEIEIEPTTLRFLSSM